MLEIWPKKKILTQQQYNNNMDLIEKCESNNVEEVGYFLVANPEAVNQMFIKNFEEATPLHFAAQYGHLAIVNMLLKVSLCYSSVYA